MSQKLLADITVEDARKMVGKSAVLIDVREPNETKAEHIPGAELLPISAIAAGNTPRSPSSPTVFLCASGARTTRNSALLASLTEGDAYCMTGGIMAWKQAGLPTERG